MLTSVHLNNFAIATELELQIKPGMTAITGETGAGKSIMVDALELLSGKRADTGFIKEGKESSSITAVFDVSEHSEAKQWLCDHG
jgi:DNA repair protein RecN (Recombination protein N)